MYCSGCGQPLAPNQPVCACGRPAMQSAPMAFLPYTRVHRHIQMLGIFWVAYSIFGILAWFVAIPFMAFIFGHGGFHHGDFPFPMSLGWILPFATLLVYLRSGLGLLVGIGLLRRDRWARPLALVIGILALFKLPIGTALGIYTLWVLMPAQSAMEYETVAAP